MTSIDEAAQAYCHSKGFDSTGLDAFDAVVGQLFHENQMVHPFLEGCKREVHIEDVALSDVTVGNGVHYKRVEARSAAARSEDAPPLAGVLLRQPQGLYLLDGYHRLKWLRESGNNQGTYIVLG